MQRQAVTSSNIKSIGMEDGVMHVEFANGRVYAYTGPRVAEHFEAMKAAPSIGTYFGQHVRRDPETLCTLVEEKAPA